MGTITERETAYTSGQRPKRAGALEVAMYILAPSYITWWTLGTTQGWICGGVATFTLLVVKSFLWHRGAKEGFTEAKRKLEQNGFKVDLEMVPNFVIDQHKRRIAFVDVEAGSYEIFDLDEVTSCEHSWSSYANVAGPTRRGIHRLVFKTRNGGGESKLFTFRISDHGAGDHWRRTIKML